MNNIDENNNSEFILYKTEDGDTRIEVKMLNKTLWLTINQMAELFDVDKSGISRHLKNIFKSGELDRESTVATVQNDGERSGMAVLRGDK